MKRISVLLHGGFALAAPVSSLQWCWQRLAGQHLSLLQFLVGPFPLPCTSGPLSERPAPSQHSPHPRPPFISAPGATVRSHNAGPRAGPFPKPLPPTSPPSCALSFQHKAAHMPSPRLRPPGLWIALTPGMCASQELCELEKVSLSCGLLQQSSPGEFGQVVQDLCALVQDNNLVRREAAHVGACHNKNNFTPVQINGRTVLLTHYNDLGGNSFLDPLNNFSFEFNHLRGGASRPQLHGVMLDRGELWREALHEALRAYVSCHFAAGNCCVFKKILGKRQLFVACLEAHQYQPSNP